MKFTIKTDELKNITNTLVKIVSKDGLGSAFSGIGIEVSGSQVLFVSHQIDFGVSYTSDVEKVEDGSVFVPIQVFDSVVGSLVDGAVDVALEGKKLTVTTTTSESEVYILEEGERSAVEKPSGSPSFSIRREVLIQGLKNVQHAAAESVVKPEIASIYLYTRDGSVYFVATDAFRLAETRFLSDGEVNDVEVLIPIKSAMKILRVLEGISEVSVDVWAEEGVLCLQSGSVLIRTNSVRGAFPDYKSIIPKEFDVTLTILKGDVTNFLKKARLFANTLNKLSLGIADNSALTLELSSEVVGVTKNSVPAAVQGSVETLPSFNYKFFSDALSVISDDRIVLSAVGDATKPIMVRGVDDTAFTAVLSPLLDNK